MSDGKRDVEDDRPRPGFSVGNVVVDDNLGRRGRFSSARIGRGVCSAEEMSMKDGALSLRGLGWRRTSLGLCEELASCC